MPVNSWTAPAAGGKLMSDPEPELPAMEDLKIEAFGTVTYPDGTVPHEEEEGN